MKKFLVRVRVRFKEGILDPQAEAIFSALQKLEFKAIESVNCEKAFLLNILAEDEGQAIQTARQASMKLLTNVVMENFEVEVVSS